MSAEVWVRTPGKVNLALHVGGIDEHRFHPLATIFHAVNLMEEVGISRAREFSVRVEGNDAATVPVDDSNLAIRATKELLGRHGINQAVAITLRKGVPVAGGMAGGSADAAAALVACNKLFDLQLDRAALLQVAKEIGSDVGFPLLGQTAIGQGYGNDLNQVPTQGTYYWVFAVQQKGLSTPAVFAEFDRLNEQRRIAAPIINPALLESLAAGDVAQVGALLHNDLQFAALSLRPELQDVIDLARSAGASGVIISGSGPTVAALAIDAETAAKVAAAWENTWQVAKVHHAIGPVAGATIL